MGKSFVCIGASDPFQSLFREHNTNSCAIEPLHHDGLMLRSAHRAHLEACGRRILRDAALRAAPQDEAD
jgi:hypothetical protein